ncbi:hypothetical protein [Chryseobacterium sp. ISL-6]|uniref:hypothetical protein n=1 Tax=Chryseobacterium sp. ISL-6 TaxID=2819143 RepID=UPI001BE9D073|nr:hypothetical protein [Chryseobacterium sp. ISL-6]MBT2621292.1 hypothetical protein [Chryseobacterium sp. ISL-6]
MRKNIKSPDQLLFSFVIPVKNKKYTETKMIANNPFEKDNQILISGSLHFRNGKVSFDLFITQDHEAYLLINDQLFNAANGEIIRIKKSNKGILKIQQQSLKSFLTTLLT